MTTSFRDGLAFCALIHRHRPDLIDFDSLSKENVYDNNHLAFRVAEEQLNIPALLDAEDMVALRVPDRLSILTYVSQYYNYFHGRSPIGGLAGVKRPSEEPIDRTSGSKNPPVTAKVHSPPKTITEPSKRDVPVERPDKSGTINRGCSICNQHVHLVQRHLVDGKLYHRNCFKCSECSNILLSGTYKPGKEPNTFICKSHQSTQKAPPAQVAPPARYNETTPTISKSPPTPKDITLKSVGKDPTQPKQGLFWSAKKNTSPSAPSPTPTPTPRAAPSPAPTTGAPKVAPSPAPTDAAPKVAPSPAPTAGAPKAAPTGRVPKAAPSPAPTAAAPKAEPTPAPTNAPRAALRYKPTAKDSVTVIVKHPAEEKVLAETPKGPSSSILKNMEARQRFFEAGSSSASPVPAAKGIITTPANEKPGAGGAGAAGGAGKDKLVQRTDSWAKEKNKGKENESEKEKAKSVISKFVFDDSSRNSSPLSQHAGLRANAKTIVSPAPTARAGQTARVLLKAPKFDIDLGTDTSPAGPSSWLRSRDKSPPRAANAQPSDNKESDAAPSAWRSQLKPVEKNTKSGSPQDSSPASDPKTSNRVARPWESANESSTPPSTAPVHANSGGGTKPPSSVVLEIRLAPGDDGFKDLNIVSSSSHSPSATTPKPSKPDYIPQKEILKELKEIEMKLDDLEKEGVALEKQLRQCEEEDQEDVLTNDLMVDWFNLIRSKQVYIRRESELVYIGRSQDLEEEQPNVEAELRKLMEKPEHLKTLRDKKREEELMDKLVEIVNDRNAIVDGLDEDRLREEEEDEQLNKMMQNLDIKKEKKKRSSMSRLFGRKSKREAIEN
ncbi:MICAL-like protein 2 [Clarias magur]|uniref:MICAL-like protein 2 n=1 Tax=Clarias magur TaxID=1594786 RepID=A0A8J4WS75_CLAMG|nr:MICAL-like protein 2 [Clarias magur]